VIAHDVGRREASLDTDFLFTVAEVSVALAGFAGLVTVLANRGTERSRERGVHLLRSMLFVSLMVTAFSLFPRIPEHYGMGPHSVWRVSSGAFFVAWVLYIVPSGMRFRAGFSQMTVTQRWTGCMNYTIHGLVGVSLFLGAVGFWETVAEAVYLSCLFAELYLAGYLFVLLFFDLLAPSAARQAVGPDVE
jgi:hypothetical protein